MKIDQKVNTQAAIEAISQDASMPMTYDLIDRRAAMYLPRTALVLQAFGLTMNEWSKSIQHESRTEVVRDPALSLLARLILNSVITPIKDLENPVRKLYERLKDNQFHPKFTLDRLGIILGRHKSSGYRWISTTDKTDLIVDRLASSILDLMDLNAGTVLSRDEIEMCRLKYPENVAHLESLGRLDELPVAKIIYEWEDIVQADGAARGVDSILKTGVWNFSYADPDNAIKNSDLMDLVVRYHLMKNDAMELFCIPEQKFNKCQTLLDNQIGLFELGGRSTKSDPTLALFVRLLKKWDLIKPSYYPETDEMLAILFLEGYKEEAHDMLGIHPNNIFRRKTDGVEMTCPQRMLSYNLFKIMNAADDKKAFLNAWRDLAKNEMARYADVHAKLKAKSEFSTINKIVKNSPNIDSGQTGIKKPSAI